MPCWQDMPRPMRPDQRLHCDEAMPSSDNIVSPPDFSRQAVRDLAECGFVAPAIGEAHVLLCDSTARTSLIGSAHGMLSPGEQARAARLHFERDRTTYILAHALWRLSLGICLDLDAAKVRLTSTAAGQPQLPGTAFSTSLSHSGSWLAIAICAGVTVGVDIECSPPRAALTALMPTICTPAEIVELAPLPALDREAALLALWTRKEALLKAFGVGLNADPSLLSATTNRPVPCPPTAQDQIPCRVFDLELPNGLTGALAVPDPIATIRLCWLGNTRSLG